LLRIGGEHSLNPLQLLEYRHPAIGANIANAWVPLIACEVTPRAARPHRRGSARAAIVGALATARAPRDGAHVAGRALPIPSHKNRLARWWCGRYRSTAGGGSGGGAGRERGLCFQRSLALRRIRYNKSRNEGLALERFPPPIWHSQLHNINPSRGGLVRRSDSTPLAQSCGCCPALG